MTANGAWLKTPAGFVRGRGLGLPFRGRPGKNNSITDVQGVEFGYSTIVSGHGELIVGKGPVRTGVTAILPRGRDEAEIPCSAGYYSLNGNGEMTGTIWIEESGELQSPITITNTAACGIARDTTHRWMVENGIGIGQDWGLPVAAETYDGELNDINGFHVTNEHVFEALNSAKSGPIELGSVGGGTGMICYGFKGGNGSASRLTSIADLRYTVGVFVQANFGQHHQLSMLGVPVGEHCDCAPLRAKSGGSIIVVVATDAPLAAHQLKKLARRVPLGIARTGGYGHDSSGDIFLAFSTANKQALSTKAGLVRTYEALANSDLDALYEATVEATEEAILDAMIANQRMVGRDGNTVEALPHEDIIKSMKLYGRM